MNYKKTRKIAEVLILSAVRARRGDSKNPIVEAKSGLRNNRITVFGFPIVTAITYLFVYRGEAPLELISSALGQAFIFLPFLSMFLMILNGLMFEITMSKYSTSTDIVNWLPLRASEYVVGSTISSIYFSLPFLMIIYGVTLGTSFYVGQTAIWIITLLTSLVSIFIGGFFIEVVRAFMNEASSAISKRGGRLSQVLQLVTTVSIIAVMALLFNYNVLLRVMDWFGLTLEQVWFIPLFWPSMTIQSLLTENTYSTAIYSIGCLILLGVSYQLGSYARTKYWVPKPITIDLGPKTIQNKNKTSLLGKNGEQAIFSKDLKALFRRKEMMTLLAIPFMLFAVNFIQTDVSILWNESAGYIDRLGVFLLPGMGLYMLSLYIGMVSIGQEGNGFINLQISPIKPKQIIMGKLPVGWSLSAISLVLMLTIVRIYINLPIDAYWGISIIGFVTITEASFLGLMFGTMFPDFTEVPRARFIRPEGSLITMIGSGIVVLLSIAPIFATHYLYSDWLSFWLSGLVSIALMVLVCWLSYRQAKFKLEKILQMN